MRDIYGGDYSRFGLAGHVVASSFGKIVSNDIGDISREDLARGALAMVTNNLTGIAKTSAAEQVAHPKSLFSRRTFNGFGTPSWHRPPIFQ